MVNENRLLPSGKLKQTMTIPSGTLNDRGVGVAEKSRFPGQGSQAQKKCS